MGYDHSKNMILTPWLEVGYKWVVIWHHLMMNSNLGKSGAFTDTNRSYNLWMASQELGPYNM